MKIEFTALGTPMTQGSMTAFVNKHTGRAVMTQGRNKEGREKFTSWRHTIASAASEQMDGAPIIEGPVRVAYGFYFARPKSHYGTGKNADKLKDSAPKWPTTKADLDKLIRAVNDAMTGVVYRDDKLIVSMEPVKFWCEPGEPERVDVVVETT